MFGNKEKREEKRQQKVWKAIERHLLPGEKVIEWHIVGMDWMAFCPQRLITSATSLSLTKTSSQVNSLPWNNITSLAIVHAPTDKYGPWFLSIRCIDGTSLALPGSNEEEVRRVHNALLEKIL